MIPRFTHFGTESIFFGTFSLMFSITFDYHIGSSVRICPELNKKTRWWCGSLLSYFFIYITVEANWLKASIPDTRPWLLLFVMDELTSLISQIQSSTCSFHLPIGVITFRVRVFYITTQSLPSWWMVFIISFSYLLERVLVLVEVNKGIVDQLGPKWSF